MFIKKERLSSNTILQIIRDEFWGKVDIGEANSFLLVHSFSVALPQFSLGKLCYGLRYLSIAVEASFVVHVECKRTIFFVAKNNRNVIEIKFSKAVYCEGRFNTTKLQPFKAAFSADFKSRLTFLPLQS